MASPRDLIIDDDPAVARMLSVLLVTTGAKTRVITDSVLALDAFAEFHPQVVILDLSMPKLDGFELCQRIRALPSADAVLVIVVSGHDDPARKKKAINAGANYYFVKPADPQRLLELVTSAGQVQARANARNGE